MGSRLRENVSHLYECFCEVVKPTATCEAWVIQKFPDRYKDEEVLKSVPKFAYPCDFDNTVVQHYSFVLTSIDSKWTFGFCRHDPRSETALVILSFLPWHEVFYRLLNHVSELLHTAGASAGDGERLLSFLNDIYQARPPDPSRPPLHFPLFNGSTAVFVCAAPKPFKLPSIPENRNLSEYYNAVDVEVMLGVFASMLFERRVVFVSRKLARLSACVQAANALLYPMSWQHIYIPVLPQHLVDYLLAPMPYLIGVPHSLHHMVDKPDVGEVVVLDTDNGTLLTPFDDLNSLPHNITKQLKIDLRNKGALLGEGVSRAFLRALVALIGGYRDALRFHQGEKITFDETAFVESRPASIQPFLSKMLHLQIFQQFIDERLTLLNAGLGFSDEFELETCNYSDKASSRLKAQYKDWTHTMRKESSAFIKTVKTKANPAVKSAVKTVKDRGKDVSKAYKGIKSRLREQLGDDKSRPRSTSSYTKDLSHSASNSVGCSSPEGLQQPPSLDMNLMADLQHVLFNKSSLLEPPPTHLKAVRSLESFVGAGGNWPMVDETASACGSSDDSLTVAAAAKHNTLLHTTQGPSSARSEDLIDWSDDGAKERWPKDSDLLLEYGLDFSTLTVSSGGGSASGSSNFLLPNSSNLVTSQSRSLPGHTGTNATSCLLMDLPPHPPPPPPQQLNWTKFE